MLERINYAFNINEHIVLKNNGLVAGRFAWRVSKRRYLEWHLEWPSTMGTAFLPTELANSQPSGRLFA
jgi:hypothetical protein